jgi:uncharacterized repeat protein (TIGR01451 family)
VRRLSRLAVEFLAALMVLTSFPTSASADRTFAQRYSRTITGDIAITGNTLMTCSSGSSCSLAQSGSDLVAGRNNDYSMVPVDVDGVFGASNSSRATLSLPPGSTVLFAGLYWGAHSTSFDRGQILFDTPATSGYQTLTASVLDTLSVFQDEYQGFRDVTGLVQAGGNGTYTAGGVRLTTGSDQYAGWALVVAYRDATQPTRSLSVFDGFTEVSPSNPNVAIRLSGFKAPSFGPVRTALGAVAYDGDRGDIGDQMRLGATVLSDAVNPSNDFFNSTISRNGANIAAKSPNYVNQLGLDADVVDASGLLSNGATQATVNLASGGETYLPGVVTFSTELYAPQITADKTLTDLNGGAVEQGDVIEYTVSGRNTGQDAAVNLRMTDAIPPGTTYVPGSLAQVSGEPAPSGARTDAAGDDSAEFSAADNHVVFRLGTGAGATAGGELVPNATFSARFRVRVNADLPPGFTLANQASFAFTGKDTGAPLVGSSPPPTPTPVLSPDFALSKTHAGEAVRGGTLTYTLIARNAGDATSTGAVTVSDTLPAALTTTALPSGTGWACTQSGQTISCTRSDPLAAGASYPPITISVRVAQDAPATLSNAASVDGAGDGNPANDTASDLLSVGARADLQMSKTATPPNAVVGDTVTFTLTATNAGPSDATGVTLADPLPAGLVLVSAPGCTGSVTCTLATLPAGASVTRTITARVSADAAGRTLANTVTGSADQPDPDTASNSATARLAVAPEADLRLAKTVGPDPLVAGGPVHFVLTVTNGGPLTATGVVVEDPLPLQVAGPVTVASDPPGASCAPTVQTVRCTFASLAAGAQASVAVDGTLDPASAAQTLANTATVTAAERDPVAADNAASVSRPISGVADLLVTKTGAPNPVRAGEELRYTLEVTNRGPSTATDTHLVDAIPSELEPTATPAGCALTGRDLDCSLGDVGPGQTRTVTLVTRVAPGFTGRIVNAARASSAVSDPNPSAAVDTETTDVVGAADLELTKRVDADPVVAGSSLTYTLTLRNAGPSAAIAARIEDQLPDGVEPGEILPAADCTLSGRTVSCAFGTLDPGAERVVTISARVGASAAGTLVNTASATSDTPDPDATDNASTTETPITASADLTLTKQDQVDPLVAGGHVVYDLVLSNAGPSTARSVTVTDALPAQITPTLASPTPACSLSGQGVTCDLGDLLPGTSRTLRIEGTVDPAFTGTLSNTAVAESATADPVQASNRSTADTTIFANADLVLEKTQSPNPVIAGEPVTYTIDVVNRGPSSATGVVVTDPVPADVTIDGLMPAPACSRTLQDVTCALGTLAPGEHRSVTVQGTVAPAHAGALTNAANVTADTIDPVPANNQDSTTSDADAAADLSVTKLGPLDPVRAGELVRYDLTLTNNGPSTALDVEVDDVLPDGLIFVSGEPTAACTRIGQPIHCKLASLAPGATETGVIIARVDPGYTGDSIANTVRAHSDTLDPDPSNDVATATTQVRQDADLSITKFEDVDPVHAGAAVTYTLSVRNDGPSLASAVTLTDPVPAPLRVTAISDPLCPQVGAQVRCDFGNLAPGESRTVRITGTVDETYSGVLTNTATVSSPTPDSDPGDNSATATTTIDAFAALQVTKLSAPEPVRAGEPLTYTVRLVNLGPSAATAVELHDALAPALAIVSVDPGPDCTYAGQDVRCAFGTLGARAERTVTIKATVDPTFSGTLANEATATTTTPSPGPATARAASTVTPAADLSLTKSAVEPAAQAGGIVHFLVGVVNRGPSTAANVVVVDTLPAGLTFVPVGSSFECEALGQTVTCRSGSLAPGATRTLDIVARIDPGFTANGATNAAVVSADTADPDPTNNAANVTIPVSRAVDLSVTKSDDPDPATAGGPLAYTLTVRNSGPSVARAATLTDTLPAALSGVTAEPAARCTLAAGTVTCAFGDIGPGETRSVRIAATIHPSFSGTLVNSARVATTTPDTDPANDSATAETAVGTSANLRVEKSATPSPVRAGETLTWTVRAVNAGPSTASAVQLVDTLPAGIVGAISPVGLCDVTGQVVKCALGDVAPGAQRTITITATVDPRRTLALANTAEVASETPDPDSADNVAETVTEVVAQADVSLSKSVDVSRPVAGQEVAWTLSATNHGPAVARAITLTDELPAGVSPVPARLDQSCSVLASGALSCTLGDLDPGETRSLVIVTAIAPEARGTLVNTARASPATQDPDATNDVAVASVEAVGQADLRVTKLDSPDPVTAGEPVTYAVHVANAGPSSARLVELTDRMPAELIASSITATAPCTVADRDIGCHLGTIAPGEERVLTFTGVVDPSTTGAVVNSVRVESETPDPDAFNNVAISDTGTGASADLAVTKSASGPARAGEPLGYTITLTNNGPSVSTSASLIDALPSAYVADAAEPADECTRTDHVLNCHFGTLAPGETRTVTVTGRVIPSAVGDLVNVATAHSPSADPDASNDVATLTTPVDAQADVGITKLAAPNPAVPGQELAYTLTAANAGPATARGVRVTDALPAAVAVTAADLPSGCSLAAGVVTCVLGDLEPDESRSVRIAGAVDPAATGTLANTASVVADTADPGAANNTASLDVPLQPAANVGITKRQSPTVAIAGQEVEYTFDIVNRGPSTAVNVSVADTLDPALDFVSATPGVPACTALLQTVRCSFATLGPGATTSVRVRARVSAGLTGTLANTAVVSADTPDPDTRDNQSTIATATGSAADLQLSKTAAPGTVTAGETVTWTLTLVNQGPSVARDVTLADPLPAGVGTATVDRPECHLAASTVTCAFATLAVGETRTVQVTAPVAPETRAPLPNTARAQASTPDPVPADNEASATAAVVARAALMLSKVAPATANAGEAVAYTIQLRNAGPSTATATVVEDTLAAGLRLDTVDPTSCTRENGGVRCALGDLAPGETRTVTLSGRIDPRFLGTLANNVRASSAIAPEVTATATTTVSAQADVRVTKRAVPAEARAGGPISYVIITANAGPSTATGVTVADAVPSAIAIEGTSPECVRTGQDVSCALGELAPGEQKVVAITGTVAPGLKGTLTNTAQATASTPDRDLTNNADTALTPLSAAADLRLTKTVDPGSVLVGGTATFVLRAENRGPSTATGVLLDVGLDPSLQLVSIGGDDVSCSGAVSCTLPTLAPGESAEVQIVVRTTAAGMLRNTAELRSETTEAKPGDEAAAAVLEVRADADVTLTKSLLTDPLREGEPAAFALEARNNGPARATNVTIRDPLPATLLNPVASVAAGTGTCSITARVVSCTFPSLENGDTAAVRIEAAVAGGTAATLLTNTATVSAEESDAATANNSATVHALIGPAADLALTLDAAPSPVSAGGLLTYTLRARNKGPDPDAAVTVRIALPAGVTPDTLPPACAVDASAVVCSLGALAAGDVERTLAIAVAVPVALAGGQVESSASIHGALADPDSSDNSAATVTPVTAPLAAPGPNAAPPAPGCLASTVRLVEVRLLDTRVRLVGETDAANAGRTVTLEFNGRSVGTAEVASDGTFRITVKPPPRRQRANARYTVMLGSLRSSAYKLTRRAQLTRLTSRAGRVTISGQVTRPLDRPPRTITVRASNDCTGEASHIVASNVKVSRSGRFTVTVKAPDGVARVYYRADTRVRTSAKNRRTSRTNTLWRGVRIVR